MKGRTFTIAMLVSVCFLTMGCAGPSPAAAAGASQTGQSSSNEQGYESLFAGNQIHEIDIRISQEDWEDMLNNALDEEYHKVDMSIDGLLLESVAFRTKGNLTLREIAQSDSDRYSFKINLGKYEDDQTLLGLDEFVLNNGYSDPSYLREYLSYRALAAIGEVVPLVTFARLSINGEYYGLYTMVESIDDAFLVRNFGSDKGNLYKQEMGSTLVYEEGSEYPQSEQKNGKDESREDLKHFIQVLNQMPSGKKGEIESVLDVDSALRYIAGNLVMSN